MTRVVQRGLSSAVAAHWPWDDHSEAGETGAARLHVAVPAALWEGHHCPVGGEEWGQLDTSHFTVCV